MTTRFKDNDLTEGLTGAIHETGHALYEQGRNLKFDGLPVNQVRSSCCENATSLPACRCKVGCPDSTKRDEAGSSVAYPCCVQTALEAAMHIHGSEMKAHGGSLGAFPTTDSTGCVS